MIRAIPTWEGILRGTLMEYRRTCGNRGCRCYRGPRHRHGPYWYLAVRWAGGRQRLFAVSKQLVPQVRRGVAAYRRLWSLVYRIAELNLEILKAESGRRDGPKRTQ